MVLSLHQQIISHFSDLGLTPLGGGWSSHLLQADVYMETKGFVA